MDKIGRYSMIPFLARLFHKAPEQPKPQEPSHVHAFDLIAKTIAEPQGLLKDPNGFYSSSVALGCTTYLWECECGVTRKEVLLGSEEPMLNAILQKVDEQGTITITKDEKKYLVGIVQQDQKPLPIR